ncbi:serine/threonine-protein kinase [Henriciella aquimarina]|uniref:serine/threonine-protein kinase n=1 Tax=Henriciella aquimarina TaxID=545261 RepID=UPI000A04561B|nr:serine/threonine-protein kinase [Henriciella aquimarina]
MKRVGRYEIQARIGQGAMAEVYRAYDPKIGRVLAIKVLKQEYCENPEYAQRFIREARAAGALSHPNIVTIYDVGDADGYPYIAMELLAGVSLDNALLARGQFAIGTVIAIGQQLADALNYAHGMGIVHRDIKPSNIMLSEDGRSIKILDFGIARVAEGDPGEAQEGLMTQVGQVVGTPRYMSPEQALSRELDGRSDLFSVGSVLYEILTGNPAFNGNGIATLAVQITQQEPPPINTTPACPRGLEFIIWKLLEKKPERRFSSGGTLLEALRREKESHDAVSAEGRRRRISLQARLTLSACAITVAFLFVAGSFVISRQNATMKRLAETSGSSIASFVATNTAVHAVENSSLPETSQDWLPVQAFINSASADPNVTEMAVIDRQGVIRAASDPFQVGTTDTDIQEQGIPAGDSGGRVATVEGDDGAEMFQFTQPITYAGRNFGVVEIGMQKADLTSAAVYMRNMLIGLGILVVAMVGCLSYMAARTLLLPLRRLKAALRDAAAGDVDFLISHQRKDEFGELYDSFNAFAVSVQSRDAANPGPAPAETVVLDEQGGGATVVTSGKLAVVSR